MSESKHINPAYISHVHLKGYKSIIDTEVELHPGLNIIIGPNGSGKTNFFEFLYRVLILELEKLSFTYNFNIGYKYGGDFYTYIGDYGKYYLSETQSNIGKINEQLLINGNSINGIQESFASLPSIQFDKGWASLQPVTIDFGIPTKVEVLSNYINTAIYRVDKSSEGFILNTEQSVFEGLRDLIVKIFSPIIIKWVEGEEYKKGDEVKLPDVLKRNLKKFSLIQDIEVDQNFSFQLNKKELLISNIQFSFYVNGAWLNWNQLSQGTKRSFYIISEVTLNKGLCFIEEPELGLYPEQLDLIMMFLKEQAEEKQIIITTHAPRILDFLKDEELNRIIITKYEKDQGTKMRHLTPAHIKHIIEYTENEGYTSDLWIMTDFFEDEESLA